MENRENKSIFALIIILAMTSWGASWAIPKLIPINLAHEVVIFWRFFITSISLIPVIIWLKATFRINKSGILWVVTGALILFIYNLLFFGGVQKGYANVGGVFVTTLNPLITFLLSGLLFKHKISIKDYLGLSLGLCGGLIVIEVWKIGDGNLFNGGNLFFILAAISWASLSIVSQKSKANMNAFVFSFYTYFLASVIAFIPGLSKGVLQFWEISPIVWVYILYLSLGATTFGTTAYFFAVGKLGANKASSFTFIVPTSAVLFSWLLAGEVPSRYTVIGGLIALLAIYLVNMKIKRFNLK